ncbi:MAG: MBL fold metallo-hydrolase [Actinobacteria bacterium]|nr:MBL fold metallo-hydrolase [Actinomycetota bacterium]
METKVDEIADGIYRLSTWVPEIAAPAGLTFNQFLIDADEPLLFHTGPRAMFPLVSEAVRRIRAVEELRWVTFGHLESDECGSMNQFLAAAPLAEVAHGALGCDVSLNDLCDRPPRRMADDEVLDLGGKRVRHLDTPHVPHNWEARVLFEETTGTLLCGDLFTHLGNGPALTGDDIVGPAMEFEMLFRYSSLAPDLPVIVNRLADLGPTTLALMHGSSFSGDSGGALRHLADAYEDCLLTNA